MIRQALRWLARLPDTEEAKSVYTAVKRGDPTVMSFASFKGTRRRRQVQRSNEYEGNIQDWKNLMKYQWYPSRVIRKQALKPGSHEGIKEDPLREAAKIQN